MRPLSPNTTAVVPASWNTAAVTTAVKPDSKDSSAVAVSSAPCGPMTPLAVIFGRLGELFPFDEAGDEPGERDDVAADVEDAAAAEAAGEQPPLGIARHAEREVGAHVPDRPDDPLLQPRDELLHERMAAVHVAFHQEHALLAGGLDHLRRRGRVERERLFAQHRLAGGDGGERHLLVKGCGVPM